MERMLIPNYVSGEDFLFRYIGKTQYNNESNLPVPIVFGLRSGEKGLSVNRSGFNNYNIDEIKEITSEVLKVSKAGKFMKFNCGDFKQACGDIAAKKREKLENDWLSSVLVIKDPDWRQANKESSYVEIYDPTHSLICGLPEFEVVKEEKKLKAYDERIIDEIIDRIKPTLLDAN